MTSFEVRLPDVGEGVAEAELLSWSVDVGDQVTPASALADVMTDKATVEIACPVTGTVVALHGELGDRLAVGSRLVTVELDDGTSTTDSPPSSAAAELPGAADLPDPAALIWQLAFSKSAGDANPIELVGNRYVTSSSPSTARRLGTACSE